LTWKRELKMQELAIEAVVSGCLEFEVVRGLAKRTLVELERYLDEFKEYCEGEGLKGVTQLTPEIFKEHVLQRTKDGGKSLVKAVVWSLRKLGGYIAVKQLLPENPAAGLRHPRISKRSKLPTYLKADQLRRLLEVAATKGPRKELVLLSLMSGTGLRPNEVANLQRGDINITQQRIDHRTKGGWCKGTPLSLSLTRLLEDYLASRKDDCPAAFLNSRHKPATISWIQKMVRAAGENAELPFRLTCNILRHTFATHTADRHGKLLTKQLLGHSHLRTTEVYTHLSERRYRAVMNLHPYQFAIGTGVRHG